MPDTMNMSLVDRVYKISDEEAVRELRLLAAQEGVLASKAEA